MLHTCPGLPFPRECKSFSGRAFFFWIPPVFREGGHDDFEFEFEFKRVVNPIFKFKFKLDFEFEFERRTLVNSKKKAAVSVHTPSVTGSRRG